MYENERTMSWFASTIAVVLAHVKVAIDLRLHRGHRLRRAVLREVARVRVRLGHESLARKHFVDDAELECLLGEEHAPRQQQIERFRRANEARQHPVRSVLGDEAAAHECGGELHAGCGEADVRHQHLRQPDSGARTVDRTNHRLRNRLRERLQAHAAAAAALAAARVDPLEHVHVGAGTEALAGAGHDDDARALVVAGLLEAVEVSQLELGCPRVVALRTVEGERRDAVLHVVEHDVVLHVGHDRFSVLLRQRYFAFSDQSYAV
jgi:hypothetical protein